jgi:hypothetical protein
MYGFLTSMLALASGEASRALFSPPTMYTSPMAAPGISAYGAPVAANVQTMGSVPYYFEPVAPASERGQPGESFAFYAAAAGLCGAVASLYTVGRDRRQAAVAELDVESVNVAMLAVKGKAGGRKPVKKAPVRKAAAKRGAAATPVARRSSSSASSWPGRSTEVTGLGEVVVTLASAPFKLVKAFFSKENWLYQAFDIVVNLPKNNADMKKNQKYNRDNTIR